MTTMIVKRVGVIIPRSKPMFRIISSISPREFISVPIAFYPTLALATPEERARFEISGSSVYWPDLDADIGADGLLAGAREHHFYARKAVERAVRQGRLPRTALEENDAPAPQEA